MKFYDNYRWLSGWIHDYYCDKDGSELIFDINNNNYFECPVCHYKYDDVKIKNIYNDVSISREIELLSNVINDQIIVGYTGNEKVDYLFHSDAKLISKFDYEKVKTFKEYPYLKNIKKSYTSRLCYIRMEIR